MTVTSWLLLGALLQGLACLLFGPAAMLPSAAVLLYRLADHLLMAAGLTRNRYLDGVIPTKYGAQIPRPDGSFGSAPAAESLVVFHLGARVNHPLGMLGPGGKALGEWSDRMIADMTANRDKYGLLGTSHWAKQDAAAGNEVLTLFYMRDYEGLHRFAHDATHMDGVRWWTRIVASHPHIAIYHETYLVPRGQWENIYINCHPTGLGEAWFPVHAGDKAAEPAREYVRPAVDARTGALRSASKRLQLGWLEEREKEGNALYDQTFTDKRTPGVPRSKFGCRTCRARRVKCDETPGACRRCLDTGRTCDGYDVHRLAPKRLLRLPRTVAQGFRWAMTVDERRSFAFFQHHTVPTFLEFFDSALWQQLVLQMSQGDPAVYHAAVALSAIHQDAEAQGMPLAADLPRAAPGRAAGFAQEQLGRAFRLLARRPASADPQLRGATLLCCLLFVLADFLRGQYDAAFAHLQSGLRILQELQADRDLVAPTPRQASIERCLVVALAHLDVLSAHFGVGGPVLCLDTLEAALPALPDPGPAEPEPFRSVHGARQAFDPVLSAVFRFQAPCMGMPDDEIARNYHTILPGQLRVWSHLARFGQSFLPFYRDCYATLPSKEQRSVDIMHLQFRCLTLANKTCVLGRNQAALAAFSPDFQVIVSLAEALLRKFPDRPTFSLEAGIIPPLYHTAISCSDYRVRWRAVQLLRSWPHREGPFDSNWVAALVEEALRIELVNLGAHSPGVHDWDDALSREAILQEIEERQQGMDPEMLSALGREEGMFPLGLVESVKCSSNWSCIRAFRIFTSRVADAEWSENDLD
ncbi:hypothetical protein BO71DRAFT_416571 [Aspergillus ellipticus CBS 707.79]|uniref:Zn(2)-C6 fungal-type domain-containing protein n=1 Tax=Aspergillus ellipticus CBS 707.79 TaxID=1448320 RepID=A0A319DN92_9EURO|nr:hypothetical protein BO71DRAFT_416571 [Aspergillus ellipticus CBS 707.79]